MLRVVIDTSSLVSYVLTRGEIMRRVIELWQADAVTVISSPQTRAELADVLTRPAIVRLSTVPLNDFAAGLEQFSTHVPGVLSVAGACRDPKDDKFLACAIEGDAHYIVTSDRDLLDLRKYRTVAIVNPGQLLLAFELYELGAEEIATRFDREVLRDILATTPLEQGTEQRVDAGLALWREDAG